MVIHPHNKAGKSSERAVYIALELLRPIMAVQAMLSYIERVSPAQQ
jgi:hypothetical protein